jgi:hypothetical protein
MKLNRTTTLSVLLGALSFGAIAQPQPPLTREQVQAELREAIRTGDIIDGYESRSRYERNPSAYPARPVVAGKTRDEVKAELAEAIRTGDIIYGETSMKLSERYPGTYPKAKTLTQPNDTAVHAAR